MPDAPTPPLGALDIRVEDGRLTVTVHGPHGPVTTCVSIVTTWAVYRMLGRNLEPGRFDGNG